jgi:3-oxoacyl-[acyl-carrier protein] reductase
LDLGLVGKTVILSGGSKGIGRAIAEEFAREGAHVAIAARGRPALDETVEAIRAAGGSAAGFQADMTDGEQIREVVARATATFGSPDIAISNLDAPDARRGSSFNLSFEDADFDQGHNELVMSVVHLTRAVLPGMKEKRWGRLINIGSHAAKEPHGPPTQMILSNVGRLGVVGLMKSLSYEYGKYGITANVLAVGYVATDLALGWIGTHGLDQQGIEAGMRKTGMGACRFGRADEVAAVAAFIASDRAGFISGECMTVTGGMYQGTF